MQIISLCFFFTGDVATAAVVIDIVAMAAVATVTAADTADSTGTYAVFSVAIPLMLRELLLIKLLLASPLIPEVLQVLCNGCCHYT